MSLSLIENISTVEIGDMIQLEGDPLFLVVEIESFTYNWYGPYLLFKGLNLENLEIYEMGRPCVRGIVFREGKKYCISRLQVLSE